MTSFISYCEGECVPTRTRTSFNNDKPWFTVQLRRLGREREEAWQSGVHSRFKEAKYRFVKAVKEAKQRFSQRLQHQLLAGNSSSVWKSLRQITNYKPKAPQTVDNSRLANDLNEFCYRFEKQWNSPAPLSPRPQPLHIAPHSKEVSVTADYNNPSFEQFFSPLLSVSSTRQAIHSEP